MSADPGRFDGAEPDDGEREELWLGLGERLREARSSAGVTQEELARRAGCAPSTVKRLELGTRRPRTSLLDTLAAALFGPGTADARDLADELRQLAGRSLRPDTPASVRRRARRFGRALRAEQVRARAVQMAAQVDKLREERQRVPPPPREKASRPTDTPRQLPTVADFVCHVRNNRPDLIEDLLELVAELRAARASAGLDPDE